jgi:drug/metabolite transporter (DMT)-like permease
MNASDRRHHTRAELLLLVVVVVWAANYPLAKWGLTRIHPFVFNAIRFVTAVAVSGAVFAWRGTWKPVERGDWPKLLAAGIVASVIYQVVFIIGLSLTTAGNSAILLSTAPLWTVFIHARMHKEKIPRMMWVGMLVSLVGVVFIIVGSGKKLEWSIASLAGDIITLTAAGLWGLNTNLQKPLLERYSIYQLTVIVMAVGAAGLTLIALPAAASMAWRDAEWTHYAATFVSGALSIGLSNLVWSHGVKLLGPGRTSNFSNLVPVLAILISFFTLGEPLLVVQFAGMGVTIAGVWVARRFGHAPVLAQEEEAAC